MSEAGEGDGGGEGGTTNVDFNIGGDAEQSEQSEQSETSFEIPGEYRESRWAQSIKSVDDLWKKHANAQSLIGKKAIGTPGEDASQEDWDKFYSSLNRPEKAEDYEFQRDYVPDDIEVDEEMDNAFKQIAHKAGLTSKQANEVVAGYEKMMLEKFPIKSEDQLENEFETMLSERFGDQADNVLESGQTFISENLSGQYSEEMIASLPNEALIMMADFAHNVKKKYGREDVPPIGEEAYSSNDIHERKNELLTIMDKYSRNTAHPEFIRAQKAWNNLYR